MLCLTHSKSQIRYRATILMSIFTVKMEMGESDVQEPSSGPSPLHTTLSYPSCHNAPLPRLEEVDYDTIGLYLLQMLLMLRKSFWKVAPPQGLTVQLQKLSCRSAHVGFFRTISERS